jgi:transposase
MAYRELSMIDVREVLRRWQAGQSARRIARDGVADRKTVGRYIEAAAERSLGPDAVLDDETVAAVARRVQERPAPSVTDEWKALKAKRERIEGWLIKSTEPLRLVRVHELLEREGVEVSYRTLNRFAHRELGWKERVSTVRVDDSPPGHEAQIDFGKMGQVIDTEGVRRKLWALIITLTFSRYMFVWPTFAQTLVALCEGLDAGWRFFGGVVRWVVPDNMTAAVIRAHPTEPVLNKSFAEYAQARGLFVDPARLRHPKDKAYVSYCTSSAA